jgi:uncharacterized protein (DUF427 family)
MQTSDTNPRITLTPATRRWRARLHGHVFADTDDAIILHEKGLAPVVYFPRQDVAMEYMGRTSHHTFCPHKGKAAYYTLSLDGDIHENVAWTYEDPYEPVGPIRDRIAFYPADIDLYEVDDAVVNPHHHHSGSPPEVDTTLSRREIDEVVQHTDSGDGVAQREHWPANVETPGPQDRRGFS